MAPPYRRARKRLEASAAGIGVLRRKAERLFVQRLFGGAVSAKKRGRLDRAPAPAPGHSREESEANDHHLEKD